MLDRCVRPSPRAEDENDPLFSAEVDFAPVFSYKRGVIKEILDQGHKQAQVKIIFCTIFSVEDLKRFACLFIDGFTSGRCYFFTSVTGCKGFLKINDLERLKEMYKRGFFSLLEKIQIFD